MAAPLKITNPEYIKWLAFAYIVIHILVWLTVGELVIDWIKGKR